MRTTNEINTKEYNNAGHLDKVLGSEEQKHHTMICVTLWGWRKGDGIATFHGGDVSVFQKS